MAAENPYLRFSFTEIRRGRGKWNRVPVFDLHKVLHDVRPQETVFISPFAYENGTPSQAESFWGCLFFDIDADNLDRALIDTQKSVSTLIKLGVQGEDIRVNFSGSKGFHITVSPFCFGLQPSHRYHQHLKEIALIVSLESGIETIDMTVYRSRTLLRCPGTKNEKSGKYAIPLTFDELNLEIPRILELSSTSRTLKWAYRFFGPKEPYLPALAREAVNSLALKEALSGSSVRQETLKGEGLPDCIKGFLKSGARVEGLRNQTAHAIATGLKALGLSFDEAKIKMDQFSSRTDPRMTSTKRIHAANISALSSVYESNKSFFSCGYIKACGSDCAGEACTYIDGSQRKEKTAQERLTLEEALFADRDQRILIRGVISGINDPPYKIPSKISVKCNAGSQGFCKHCVVVKNQSKTIELKSAALGMELIAATSTSARQKLIESQCGIPDKCIVHKKRIVEELPIHMAEINPVAGKDGATEKFRTNRVYVRGEILGLQDRYEMSGFSVPHPKTAETVHWIDKTKKLGLEFDDFKLTEEDIQEIEIFQVSKYRDIYKVTEEILAELETTAHTIKGRDLQALAYMLCWHSPLHFDLEHKRVDKGWLTLLAYGDTGQGKTDLFNSLADFYGFGSKIAAPATSFAGLVAGIDRSGGRYMVRVGELCRLDRQIIGIDEYHRAPHDITNGMADVIDTGVARLTKITASISANARARIILMANPIDEKNQSVTMASAAFGVEHVLKIMKTPEDVRRIDIAVPFNADCITPETILSRQQAPRDETRFPKEACRKLIRWIWSRRKDQVKVGDDAWEEALLNARFLSDKYHAKIPLLQKGDASNKIIRVAIACAGMTFSTSDHETLHVAPEHVAWAADFLDQLYSLPDMQFDGFSGQKQLKRITEADIKRMNIDLMGIAIRYDLMDALSQTSGAFSSRILLDTVGTKKSMSDEPGIRRCLHWMRKEGWLEGTNQALVLTDRGRKGINLAKDWYEKVKNDKLDIKLEGEDELREAFED